MGKPNQSTLAPQVLLFAPTSPHNTPFLPISPHYKRQNAAAPAHQEVRRLSFVHTWYMTVTPLGYLLYAISHLYPSVLHLGQTHLAPAQQLRKHAVVGVDNSTLHKMMATSEEAPWGICLLEYEADRWWVAVRDWGWWWQLRR